MILPPDGVLERALQDDIWKPFAKTVWNVMQTRVVATLLYCDHPCMIDEATKDRAKQMINANVAHLPALLRALHEE